MSGVGRLDLIHQFSRAENKKRAKAKPLNKHLSGVSHHVWSEVAFLANLTRPETEQFPRRSCADFGESARNGIQSSRMHDT